MRFKENSHQYGDIREVSKFAWLPITIYGETRWLEFVTIRQMANMEKLLTSNPFDVWENVEFI